MATAKKHKMILSLGYNDFVLDADAAIELFKTLSSGVELYESVWNGETRKAEPRVKPMMVDDNTIKLRMLPEESYAMGKLLYAADQSKQGESK